MDTLQGMGYLRLPDVLKYIPVSKSTWWAGVKSGRFPASVKIGDGVTAWQIKDIRECLLNFQQQKQQRK